MSWPFGRLHHRPSDPGRPLMRLPQSPFSRHRRRHSPVLSASSPTGKKAAFAVSGRRPLRTAAPQRLPWLRRPAARRRRARWLEDSHGHAAASPAVRSRSGWLPAAVSFFGAFGAAVGQNLCNPRECVLYATGPVNLAGSIFSVGGARWCSFVLAGKPHVGDFRSRSARRTQPGKPRARGA